MGQKAADEKKVEDVKNAESGSFFDGVKNFFGPKAEAKAEVKPVPPAEPVPEVKPVPPAEPPIKPVPPAEPQAVGGPQAIPPVGRMFGGKKSKRRRESKARKSAKK